MNGTSSREAQRASSVLDESLSEFEENGFAIARDLLTAGERDDLILTVGRIEGAGRRGILAMPAVRDIARSENLLHLVGSHLRGSPKAVRAIFFDKSPDANWLVPWHQDLTLALRRRCEVPGFGPWSIKEGIPHAQPPVELLEQMLTIRLHLDDADESNGALRVLVGSHRLGRLSSTRIQELRGRFHEVVCRVCTGDALLMRPLLLHASSRSDTPRHRRVLHIEYAAFTLPDGLEWHEAA